MQIEHAVQARERLFRPDRVQIVVEREPGVGEHRVETAPARHREIDEGCRCGGIRQIALDADHLESGGGQWRRRSGRITEPREHDARPGARERFGRREPDPARGTRDDRDLALEAEERLRREG